MISLRYLGVEDKKRTYRLSGADWPLLLKKMLYNNRTTDHGDLDWFCIILSCHFLIQTLMSALCRVY